MKNILTFLFILVSISTYSQQYDTVIMEEDSIDSNNQVYRVGNVYIYDYEIIQNGVTKKLKSNTREAIELVPVHSESIGIDKIHLLIRPSEDSKRTNDNQTQISYLQGPIFGALSATGLVDNSANVWIHPIREGFFKSLETCPFPFVKKPVQVGLEWEDAMQIGEGWGNSLWGEWKGSLLLNYHYIITGKEWKNTKLGQLECYVIEGTATSNLGTTRLKAYFNDQYGFVRQEFILLTDIKINFWLVEFMENKEFNDVMTFFKTKEYLKEVGEK
jgi:hypothetical protein